jgi:osmotically-inducible protein OsmY
MGAQPSINIIVDHGRVTLQGFVDTESDRVLAGSLIRQMSGVLSVDNQLRVD